MVHINLDESEVERLDALAEEYTNGNRTKMVSQLVGLFGESAVLRDGVEKESPEVSEGYYSEWADVVDVFEKENDCSRSHAYSLARNSERVHEVSEVASEVAERGGVSDDVATELENPDLCGYYVPEEGDYYLGDADDVVVEIMAVVEQID
jgi:hypothetical protein